MTAKAGFKSTSFEYAPLIHICNGDIIKITRLTNINISSRNFPEENHLTKGKQSISRLMWIQQRKMRLSNVHLCIIVKEKVNTSKNNHTYDSLIELNGKMFVLMKGMRIILTPENAISINNAHGRKGIYS